jgi:hypothetical protein
VSRPLRSTATPASRRFTATTSRSASERRNWYSLPPVSAVGRLPLATLEAYDPGRRINARLLTFRARAADQAHAASTPGTTWPGTRAPARLIPRGKLNPRFRCHLNLSTPQRRHPAQAPAPGALERLPDPHLTQSSRAFSLVAHHDGLQPTQHQGGLAPAPAGPTLNGQQSSISHAAPPM